MRLKISMIDAPCGAGKSHEIKSRVLAAPGQHLIAVPTGRLMAEYAADLGLRISELGLSPNTLRHFISGTQGADTIARLIGEAKASLMKDEHAIFLITHAALLGSLNHAAFEGWHLWIDEVPSLLISHVHSSSAIGPLMAAHYELNRLSPTISRVTLKPDSDLPPEAKRRLTVGDLMEDKFLAGWAEIARHCTSGAEVLVNLGSWKEVPARKRWRTLSIFDCRRLTAFASIQIYGNAISHTVTYQWLEAHPEVDILQQALISPRSWLPRPVSINYFAQHHLLTASNKPVWEANLRRVEEWIREQKWSNIDAHFWMTNRDISVALPGPRLEPMSHGLNHLQDRDSVTVLYRSKPDRDEARMFGQLGINRETLVHQREHEVIAQAVMRGSIRDPNCTNPFVATVYNTDQAERLRTFLAANYGMPVSVNRVELDGFVDEPARTRAAGRPRQFTDKQRESRQRDRMKIQRAKAKLSPEQRADWRQHIAPELRLKQMRLDLPPRPQA